MIHTYPAEKPANLTTPFNRFYTAILLENKDKSLNELIPAMLTELSTVGAKTLDYDVITNQWIIEWDEDMYTFFTLKWS